MDEDDDHKPLMLFGRDVTRIPCFRNSFLSGITCGIVGGLGTFMFTSKPKLATHVGMASFVSSTWCYFVYCRYTWSKQQAEVAKLQELIERHATYAGTPKEREIDKLPLVDA
ncbi:cytochrome c oxidase assembly protein COX20, mitochondrial [Diprion similis]|uniref:cytochrome c oxidase assembly protein COX20, mitochondrial n=1 Tax=Diprion similis TaxID=362088 RepID=UPI001EF777D6|nr:cytochrome c oxidase assembly protein COX20, mitochondrial [Diprion similis]